MIWAAGVRYPGLSKARDAGLIPEANLRVIRRLLKGMV